MPERNHTEIWSTRLQREILALESSDDESKKIEILPPFIKAIAHKLSIEGGIAKIEFRIDVELSEEADATSGAAEAAEKKEEGGIAMKMLPMLILTGKALSRIHLNPMMQ